MEDVEREDKKISPLIIDFVFSFFTSLFVKTSGALRLMFLLCLGRSFCYGNKKCKY